VCPRAVLDAVMKRKIPSPRRESKRRTPIPVSLVQEYILLQTQVIALYSFSWVRLGYVCGLLLLQQLFGLLIYQFK
jgi:hypothetical protein